MPITRAQAEGVLVERCRAWLAKAGMAVTSEGANADLRDAIRSAVVQCGGSIAASPEVADADLATLEDTDLAREEFYDRAELRTLKTIRGRFARTSVMVAGAVQTYTSDLLRALDSLIRQTQAEVSASWGAGGGGVSIGTLYNPTAETLECEDDACDVGA